MRPEAASDSQAYRLRHRMREAGLEHGDRARVTLTNVRVGKVGRTRFGFAKSRIYFCDIGPLQVDEVLEQGDGGDLPEEAAVKNIRVKKAGRYNIEGAILHSNGKMEVSVDAKSSCKLMNAAT